MVMKIQEALSKKADTDPEWAKTFIDAMKEGEAYQ